MILITELMEILKVIFIEVAIMQVFVFIIFKILDKKEFFTRESVKFHMNKNVLMKKYDKKATLILGAILCILNIIPIWM